MKKAALILFVLLTLNSSAKNMENSHHRSTHVSQWSDQAFITLKVDLMPVAPGVYRNVYRSMHASHIINQLTFSFASDSAPAAYTTSTTQYRFEFPMSKRNSTSTNKGDDSRVHPLKHFQQ